MKSFTPSHEVIVATQYFKEFKMKAFAFLGAFVAIVFLMVVGSILNGYALSVLWGWFVVPTFGAPTLKIVPAIGLAMVVTYLTHQTNDCQKEKEKDATEKITASITMVIVKPLAAIFFGWIIHQFM